MTENNISLINTNGLAEISTSLLDKLSTAIGWVVTHKTPKRIAIDTYIKGIENSNLPPLVKAAKISNAKREIREYINQYRILEKASANICDETKIQFLDDDFLAMFMDKARHVSDDDFQMLWSAILASECEEPGSTPKGLLHILSIMEKEEAIGFNQLVSLSVEVFGKLTPMIPKDFNFESCEGYELFSESMITYELLMQLEALGLIKIDYSAECHVVKVFGDEDVVRYFGHSYKIKDGTKDITIGSVVYTKSGNALAKKIEGREVDGFWERVVLPMINNAL